MRVALLASMVVLASCDGGHENVADENAPAQSTAVTLQQPAPLRTANAALAFTAATMSERPAYRVPTVEAGSGTIVTRISGAEIASGNLRHSYAKNQPWNADGTLLMLGFSYP